MLKQVSFYATLTPEERTRAHPCKKTKCVMMSSTDSSSPAQASISATNLDMVDHARLGKINTTSLTTSQPLKSEVKPLAKADTDVIEEAVPIVQTTLPVPESEAKIEKNGLDFNAKKSTNEPDDECLINCIYYTQQCCDCTIV
ncbi:uncharacterized protein LOC105426909 isoform X3 [Pogonomyrmex barbatus]|uniref:Uncharacterized protein LOC105426909 isoform X3 n=1 Tax=Pogonomyrmex barbatus TaxID=144034 RepID=A0A6I9WXH8_9HYME|nr:uncharacterized protein LOC105426909 isoform X3 [Pogonomyrmex barbatus]XP_011636642.1 uncharacterized protein LOC105426909 isoform X3 [Pogonomyrmex barbatus]XP_025073995.1 uncharacterized protein LOC105426909 isoform X3 [Pogonomyrmex barbatus]XP_025073996.1 uncharacterized protein LOC105426909 isoform X3 [Pogonomyrmex barbatus]